MAWTTPGTAVAGEVLTAAFWNEQVRDNTTQLFDSVKRLGFQTRTTNYTVDQTAVASAADIFSSDITWTADGSTYLVEFYCYAGVSATGANGIVQIHLVDGSGTSINLFGTVGVGDGTRSAYATILSKFYYTPASGSRSINVRAVYGNAGNGTLSAGNGASGNAAPMYLSLYGPVLT